MGAGLHFLYFFLLYDYFSNILMCYVVKMEKEALIPYTFSSREEEFSSPLKIVWIFLRNMV